MRKRFRKPHYSRKKKSIFKNRFFQGFILAFVLLGGSGYFFLLSGFFQVKDVVITGQQRILAQELESIIGMEVGKSIFLINPDKIKERVSQKFPQIAELEVKRTFPNVLNLALAERKEVGIFCFNDDCFLLDSLGVIFQELEGRPNYLPKMRNLTLKEQPLLGAKVFDPGVLELILEVERKLRENLGISLEELSLFSQDRLNVKTSQGWEIYFNPKKDVNRQLASLATVLERSIPPEKRSSLKYIDLRFSKIFLYPAL